ncbi:MAG: hypothetical protein ABSG03_39510 [Bryobacteraceae bacterium]
MPDPQGTGLAGVDGMVPFAYSRRNLAGINVALAAVFIHQGSPQPLAAAL